MRFQLSQRYTKEDFAAYYRAATKNSTRQADRFRHLFQCYLLISSAVLAGLAIFVFFSSFQIPPLIFSVPAAFLLAIVLLQSAGILLRNVLHSTDQKKAAQLWDSYPFKGREMSVIFEDSKFILYQPYYESHYQYAAVSIILEDDSHYFYICRTAPISFCKNPLLRKATQPILAPLSVKSGRSPCPLRQKAR